MAALWDQVSEQSVIGAIANEGNCIAAVAAIIGPDDFHYGVHSEIMAAALGLHDRDEPIDLITLTGQCRPHAKYIGQLAADGPGAANVEAYARRVADYARRRAVVQACRAAIERAERTEAGSLAADLATKLEETSQREIGESLSWRQVLNRTVESIELATQAADDGVTGVRTRIPVLDDALGGLCPQRFIVLAARPSIGKTALGLQIAISAARDGVPGGICSLEMGEDELGARAMANVTGANFTRLLRGRNDALDAMVNGMRSLDHPEAWPLHLDTSTYSLTGIEARITAWRRKHGIQYAVVDHIGLVEVEGNLSTYDRVSLVSRRLKKLAKRLDIAIIGVAQLNRALEKERRKPTLADLRDSGNIEQDIDAGVFLHVDPDDLEQQPTPVHIGFLKNRTGRRGWVPPLMFDGARQRFFESADDYGDDQ